MSFSPDRNPPPPPEILESDANLLPDRIGNTVYSKRWLYKALMNMLQVVQDYPSIEDTSREESILQGENKNNFNQPMELDSQIEEEACTLWDMSASQEVSEFLCECGVADIFLEIIDKTKSPRLLEIVVGILGNMSTYSSTCEYITKQGSLVRAITMLTGCSDSCTLVQLFRLLTCGIVKENCQQEWFHSFEENPFFMENLTGILQNNLCRDVLKGLLEFLDSLFSFNSIYCAMWGEEPYALAIIESGKQLLKCNHNEDLDIFFTVVNTLCQHSSNISIYAKNYDTLRPVFHMYFSKLGEEEYLPQISRVTAVTYTFALYGNLLFSGSIPSEHIKCDPDVYKAMLNTCQLVKRLFINIRNSKELHSDGNTSSTSSITMTQERNGDSLDDEDTVQTWVLFLDAIVHAARACITLTDEANEIEILKEIISFEKTAEDLVS